VPLTQFLDDFSTGRGFVADGRAADAGFKFVKDIAREAVGEEGKWFFEMDSGHLPVSCGGVFSGRRERAATEGGGGTSGRGQAKHGFQIAETHGAEVGHG
jgi:hypothetical protein